MSDPAFFGYGSLVNLNTHAYPNPRVTKITGWRRIWRSLEGRSTAILSVTPDRATTLSGIIADVPGADWSALDAREGLYVRQSLPCGTAVYQVTDSIIHPAAPHPILRSYLDVVAQGYMTHFGQQGVTDFFATTDGWGPVKDDRASPLYPRHQQVSAQITDLVDRALAAVVK